MLEDILVHRSKPKIGGSAGDGGSLPMNGSFGFNDRDATGSYSPRKSNFGLKVLHLFIPALLLPLNPKPPFALVAQHHLLNQSDEKFFETEARPGEEQDNVDWKHMGRKESNRESARRSRKKKQAHLADLELQVDELRGENSPLYEQLTDANQHFGEAITDNRILKSDDEALRVKLKMAEDLVARGSLTCNLYHLLQSPIISSHLNAHHQVSPILELQGNDACYMGRSLDAHAQTIGNAEDRTKNGNVLNRVTVDYANCSAEIWPWVSHASLVSKQL